MDKPVRTQLAVQIAQAARRLFLQTLLNRLLACWAIALGLIVTEAVTNATKYAFPGKRTGKIGVGLFVHEDRVKLTIRVDGIGATGGGDPALSGGLGRSLMEGLAGQLSGTLTVRHEQGTEVVVEFQIDRVTQMRSKAVEAAAEE